MSATSVGEIGLDLVVNQKQFNKQMSGITSLAKKAGAALAAAFAVKKIADFGKQCLELGSDLQEVQNVVDVTFPHMTSQVDQFAKSAAQSFGLSETMAKRYTGTFGAMAKAFGFTESAAYEMSTTLTGLAGDVASFYNITQDEAYTKLKSVFTGETESLKELGVVMTQAALDQYALANGYGKTTSAMTEQEKVALRYAFVQQQLSAAQGDFARTSDSWANQTRIMSLQLQSIMATIGQGLINLFTPVIKIVNTVLGKIATLANAFKSFTELITGNKSSGGSSVAAPVSELASAADTASSGLADTSGAADSLADSTKDVGSAAKKAAKEMKALMGFDQIQKLDQTNAYDSGTTGGSSGTGTGAGSLGSAVDFGSLAAGETVIDKVDSQMSGLLKRAKELANLFKKGFKIGFGDSEKTLASIQKSIDGIGKSLKDIFTDGSVVAAANNLADEIALSLGKIVGSVANIGLSIADNLLGGVDQYLSQSSEYIKGKIVSILDASSNVAALAGNYAVALADIFSVVSSPAAKQCTASLIGIFSDGFLGIVDLGARFISDFATLVVVPVTDNVDKIKLAFENILSPISTVLTALHQSVQTTFSAIGQVYDTHVRPMVDSFVQGISSIVSTMLDGFNTYIAPVLDQLAEKFVTVWNGSIQPAINTAIGLIGKIADLIKILWENVIQPFIDEFVATSAPVLGQAIQDIGGFVLDLLATFGDVADGILTAFGGVIDFFTGVFSKDWEKTTEGLKSIADGLKKVIESVFSFIRDNILQPFDDFLSGIFEKDWTESFGVFGEVLNTFFDTVETIWDTVKGIFEGITEFLTSTFSGDWEGAWNSIVGIFETVFGGIVDIAKTPINAVIGLINGMLGALESGLNWVISKINTISFEVPSWVPGIGGQVWGFNLPAVSFGRVPYLAEGGYVKANTPQLAMIGDNRHQGEIVAPEDKLQAMVDAAVKAASTPGLTRDEVESIINQAVMRIVAALSQMGFYIDSEEIARATQKGSRSTRYQFNKVDLQ